MCWKNFLLLTTIVIFGGGRSLACHKGGPMGFATNDPGAFSIDITMSPTYSGASTFGTAGCKDWDYSQHQRNHFLKTQWAFLNEDAARGKGEHLMAFNQIMGCAKEQEKQFAALVKNNYYYLFGKIEARNDLLNQLEILISENSEMSCSI